MYDNNIHLVTDDEINTALSKEKLNELIIMIRLITGKIAMPLYLAFWICDLIFSPENKWLFLLYRVITATFCILVNITIINITNYRIAQRYALAVTTVCSFFITVMVFQTGGPRSEYYAGLNLACIAMLLFFPLDLDFCIYVIVSIYLMYFSGCTYLALMYGGWESLILHGFFISSTIIISLVIRFYNKNVKSSEIKSRLNLENEISNRNNIISIKTSEAINLSKLSTQFSPQLVHLIKEGKTKIESKVHRSNICAIFIDIVNSTERVTRIDKDDMNAVITMFMDDTIKILLKYDITIDKFLGDGVLAFSNDPIQYPDYVDRVLNSAIEIKELIISKQNFYLDHWLRPFEIKIGISSGFANVGFYGNEKYFKVYTGIGPVINLANRLSSVASPNQIVISKDIIRNIQDHLEYEIRDLEMKTFKGFENDHIQIYELHNRKHKTLSGVEECPKCNGILHIENEKGIYIFKCHNCNHTIDT